MRNKYVTPAFRPPFKNLDTIKGGVMRKLRLVCQKSEIRVAQRQRLIARI